MASSVIAKDQTVPLLGDKLAIKLPSGKRHKQIVLSRLPLVKIEPSALKQRLVTGFKWPFKVWISFPSFKSQILIICPPALARIVLSGLIARASIACEWPLNWCSKRTNFPWGGVFWDIFFHNWISSPNCFLSSGFLIDNLLFASLLTMS